MNDSRKENAPAATRAEGLILTAETIINAEKISNPPEALRDLSAWLIWKFVPEPGSGKPRKVPYYAKGGARGKHSTLEERAEDRPQLVTFKEAVAAAAQRQFDGVGFAPYADLGIVALDFDNCIVDGGVHPDVEKLVAGTYAEYSPSGNGVRAFMRGNLGNHKDKSEPFGFETFSTKGFVTFTGNRLDITELLGNDNTVSDVTEDVNALSSARFRRVASDGSEPLMAHKTRLGLTPSQIDACLAVLDPNMGHDPWLYVGMALHHETEGQGFDYWNDWSANGSTYPTEETLRRRWESFGNTSGRLYTARYLVKLANENGAGIALDVASADDFETLIDEPMPGNLRFRVVPAGEFAQGKPPGWIIKGVIPRAELVVLFGESGAGKSFVALDMAAAIARGVDWRGHRTKPGRVVYIAAEGGGGFRNRLQAYERHNEVNLLDMPLGIIHAAPNFLQKADAIDVTKAIIAAGKADVIFVDTFAQVIPGANENAAEDIGKALVHCRGIHRATGAVVILVHHAGKDPTKGARGWSGLRAAADAELEVLRTPTGRMLRVSKQKDGNDGLAWGFDLEMVQIGMDEDGDVVQSCIVKPAEVPLIVKPGKGHRPLGKWERAVQAVVDEIAIGQNSGIEVDHVLAEVVRRSQPVEDGKRDTRRQHAKRALVELCTGDDAPYFMEGDSISVRV